ncbi:MAG TPA: hypothetical protein VEP89_10410 [Draconibacterium sp.]|nr:hypothetical protein [Draconibacterium sp.]
MKPKLRFDFNSEKEYSEYKGYPPERKERDFHVTDHFIVPWELAHDKKKDTAKKWEKEVYF